MIFSLLIFLDCTAPFIVNFHTDGAIDTSSTIAPASRGIFLLHIKFTRINLIKLLGAYFSAYFR